MIGPDKFDSIDSTAYDALNKINSQSICEDKEFAGLGCLRMISEQIFLNSTLTKKKDGLHSIALALMVLRKYQLIIFMVQITSSRILVLIFLGGWKLGGSCDKIVLCLMAMVCLLRQWSTERDGNKKKLLMSGRVGGDVKKNILNIYMGVCVCAMYTLVCARMGVCGGGVELDGRWSGVGLVIHSGWVVWVCVSWLWTGCGEENHRNH
ncbi:hypothetical protein ACLB1Q_22895 [Escherichia coli]